MLREFWIDPAAIPIVPFAFRSSRRCCAKRLRIWVLCLLDENDSRKWSFLIPIELRNDVHFLQTVDSNCLYFEVVDVAWAAETADCR